MPGDTTSISVQRFSADWAANVPIRALCERYAISKDQLSRLCRLWGLQPRTNRATYFKPAHPAPPSVAEDEASGRSCDLAPDIRKRIEDLRRGVGGPVIHGTPMHVSGPVEIQVFGLDSAEPQAAELFTPDDSEGPKETDFEWDHPAKRALFQDLYGREPKKRPPGGRNSKDRGGA